jgi:UDP-GlcNAc:undecaprenyl-phosphate GlcNAc-1-phosphate transferase
MYLLPFFYAFTTALCVALVIVPFLRRWAIEQGTLDLPDERKVHATAVPRLGGIAIYLAFLFSALIFAPLNDGLRGILAGGLVVFALGIADDLDGLSSKQKLFGQIIACLVTIAVGELWLTNLGDLFGFGPVVLPAWFGIPFTVFAVTGLSNAINLIDGLDGLAGGLSVLALTAFALLGLLDGATLVPILALALAGAILGFLKYNFYPARIFMGDAGSLSVGFLLGFLAVHLTQRPGATVSPMVPVMILGLPIFDALWVMSRRIFRHISPFAPDQSHVHHKFLNLGFEHRFTVLIIYTVSLFWSCSALLLQPFPEYVLLTFLLCTALVFYQLLRALLNHQAGLRFFRKDTERGLRQSVLFNRIVDAVDRALPLLGLLLGLYLLLAVLATTHDGNQAWWVACVALAGGVLLRISQSDRGGEFQLLLVYVAACIAAFDVWTFGGDAAFPLSVKRSGDFLLLLASLFVVAKLVFRRPGEFFLTTSDYLALTLMAFLAVASQQSKLLGVSIAGPLLRAMLLVLAVRTIASRGPATRKLLVNVALLLLAIFALSGFLLT